jgi:ATP-dependent DNA helicase RecG
MAPDWVRASLRRTADIIFPEQSEVEQYNSTRRLKAMLDTNDGFKIAEIDMELRGPGDFFGTRQSGLPSLQIANLLTDGDILAVARREAFQLIDEDPHLRLPQHRPLREYFYDRMRGALEYINTG